ncbi:hypothetical protein [uncultured Photobacterium sp.]|uniref:hypothetical protein n=1 Tax=uncultured Photobacterium sp. TaxID=173973 RepID=UPI00263653C3|nr:hypothetical protein [uncultured Photobacterium sp.]
MKETRHQIHFELFSLAKPPLFFLKKFFGEEAAAQLQFLENNDGDEEYFDIDSPSDFFKLLSNLISPTDDEEQVSGLDMRNNLTPWDSAKQIVAKHNSEWYAKAEERSFLNKLIDRFIHPDFPALIEHEKTRMDNLVWIQDSPSLNLSKEVWNWWPLGNNSTCICGSPLTLVHLEAILSPQRVRNGLFEQSSYSTMKNISSQLFLDKLNAAMDAFGVNTCLDKIHFLAQALIESNNFKTTEEYRNNNGSIPSGWNNYRGGNFYHGRGIIQVTHKDNYAKYWRKMDVATMTDNHVIKLSSDLHHSLYSALWFWRFGSAWGDISNFAKANDFLKVTIAVNGGYNHVFERNKALLSLSRVIRCNTVSWGDNSFKNFKFEDSSISNSRWYRNNTSTVNLAKGKLEGIKHV